MKRRVAVFEMSAVVLLFLFWSIASFAISEDIGWRDEYRSALSTKPVPPERVPIRPPILPPIRPK